MIATTISLAGNIQLALPHHAYSPFAWLEAIAPPLLVLSTAYVLKEQVLEIIQQRHANEYAYQTALSEWQAMSSHPESYPYWTQCYANALRDALRQTNARRTEALQVMTVEDWKAAVLREMHAEHWYSEPEAETEAVRRQPVINSLFESVTSNRNGNGLHPKAQAAG